MNFMIFLQSTGVDYAVAVGLGTLFGPAQVGARVIESLLRNALPSDMDHGRILRVDGGRLC